MESDEFDFIPGPDPATLRIVFRGFWDMRTVDRYREALYRRAVEAGGATATRRVLLDLGACSVQSPEVVGAMAEMMDHYTSQIERYGMLLPRSALTALQMKRLMAGRPVTFFGSEEEASAWLAS